MENSRSKCLPYGLLNITKPLKNVFTPCQNDNSISTKVLSFTSAMGFRVESRRTAGRERSFLKASFLKKLRTLFCIRLSGQYLLTNLFLCLILKHFELRCSVLIEQKKTFQLLPYCSLMAACVWLQMITKSINLTMF